MKMFCSHCKRSVKAVMVNEEPTCPRCAADLMGDFTVDSGGAELKKGARHSAPDNAMIQHMHDYSVSLGATCNEADGDEAPAKSAAAPEPGMNFTYIKSLHTPLAEQQFKDLFAVKATGKDSIKGYSMLWGNPELVDVEMDFFTKATNFWDSVMGLPRPLTYDHGQDDATKADSVIGDIQQFGDDDIGRWYEAQLKRGHAYRAAVDRLISKRALGTSSDSAPQYVQRERTKSGAHWISQWPWFASALTPTPAEPRMFDSVHFKSLGVVLPAQSADAPLDTARDLAIEHAISRFELLKRSV